jgi:hypothetical protein
MPSACAQSGILAAGLIACRHNAARVSMMPFSPAEMYAESMRYHRRAYAPQTRALPRLCRQALLDPRLDGTRATLQQDVVGILQVFGRIDDDDVAAGSAVHSGGALGLGVPGLAVVADDDQPGASWITWLVQ